MLPGSGRRTVAGGVPDAPGMFVAGSLAGTAGVPATIDLGSGLLVSDGGSFIGRVSPP